MNFRKASESLSVSQPTLSQQISQVEERIGCTLLARSSKGFTLTDEGSKFLRLCQELIQLGVVGLDDIRTDRQTRPLRVGIPSYQSYRQIELLLTGFKEAFPGVFPHLVEMTAVNMCSAFREDKLDIAFMSLPTPLELPTNLDLEVLWSARYELCVSASHPLAAKPALQSEDISDLPLILLPESEHSQQFNYQMEAIRNIGVEPVIYPSEISHVSAQISLAATGAGACLIVPNTMVIDRGVRSIPTDPPLPELKLGLFWKRKSLNPMVERFVLFARSFDIQAVT
jgi:DNA-binding transcriptional LysR family regulator